MALLARHPVPVAIVAAGVAATALVLFLARPQGPSTHDAVIHLPAKSPAAAASGAAGWVWKEGTPGWSAGRMIDGMNVSGLQPVELQRAQLAAARAGLDSQDVRVLTSLRGGRDGVLAILAAPTLDVSPVQSCLAPLLTGDTPVEWLCPGSGNAPDDLGYAHVLVAAKLYDWKAQGAPADALYLAGVARGDVRSVALLIPGESPRTLYTRGETWGQFEAAVSSDGASEAVLKVYSDHGSPESLAIQLAPGEQGSFH